MLRTGLSWGERVVYWLIILGLGFAFLLQQRARLPVAIFVNGKPVAWLGSVRLAQRAVNLALEELRKRHGPQAEFAETIEIGSLPLRGETSLVSPAEAAQQLLAHTTPAQRAWLITVNEQPVVALTRKADAEEALEAVKAHFTPPYVTLVREPRFKERVTVREGKVPVGQVLPDAKAAVQKLIGGLEPPHYHIVRAGEVGIRIARRYGLTLVQLQQLNPDKNLDRLKVGDKLLVKRGKPLVTVVVTYQVLQREPVPYKVERRFAPHLPGGALVTQQKGREGLKEVVLEVTCENGVEVIRKVVKERIVKEPVTEVILVGGGLRR